jgi:hypothetical protein
MNEEELRKIKEELKHEIINELTRKDYVKDNTWKTIKKEFTQMFYSKGYKDTYELTTIFSGIQCVLRTSLGYRGVEMIPAEKYEEAKKVMFTLFNLYPNKEERPNKP